MGDAARPGRMSAVSREQAIREGAAAHLTEQHKKQRILSHTVQWDKYANNKTLTNKHITALEAYDKRGPEVQEACLNTEKGALIAEALTLMIKRGAQNDPDDLNYVLTLIDSMLTLYPDKVALFRALTVVNPFNRLLDVLADSAADDEQQLRLITHILGLLHYPGLGNGPPLMNEQLSLLASYVKDSLDGDKLQKGEKHVVNTTIHVTSCLMVFLRESSLRTHVNDMYNFDRHLSLFLGDALKVGNVQLLYQVGFCLWLLSYDPAIAERMDETDVVVNILKVMKSVSKEKVIRVCLACLRNLVDKAGHNQTMIDNAAVKQLAVLRNRKWSDDEVREDLDFISDALAKGVHVLSSLDMYRKEIAEGKLEWTPVHKSEMFWRDNVVKICPVGKGVADSEDLLALIELLNEKMVKAKTDKLDDEDVTTVAVICHDLGEFARFHPQGKKILTGDAAMHADKRCTKDLLMSIMSNPPGGNEEIGKQALTCIPKMMVTNWQFL